MDSRLKLVLDGDPEEVLMLLIRLKDPKVPAPYCRVITQFGDIITCRVQRKYLLPLYNSAETLSVKAPRLIPAPLHQEDTEGVTSAASTRMPSRRLQDTYTGKGVFFAAIDWGFDFAHANLRQPDGTTRFQTIWDQNGPYDGNSYGYGCIYSKDDIDKALQTETPYQTLGYHPGRADIMGAGMHGTHVVDIATGTPVIGEGGVAPEATLIGVELGNNFVNGSDLALGDSVRLVEALHFISKVAHDAPCVINMSLGSHGDSHTGKSLVEIALDNFLSQTPGFASVQSVGNYYQSHCHLQHTLKQDEVFDIEWNIPRKNRSPDEVEIWYPGTDEFSLKLFSPDGTQVTYAEPFKDIEISYQSQPVGYIFHRSKEPNTGLNHIDIILDISIHPGKWIIQVTGTKVTDGSFHAYSERNDAGQAIFSVSQCSPLTTTGSVCNNKNTIAVGAYDHKDSSKPVLRFSSSGPTVFGQPKPDLLAPGYKIAAARSAPPDSPVPSNLLTIKSGSSMAAPHVSGTLALLFEKYLQQRLVISQIKDLLFTSLDRLPGSFSNTDRIRAGKGYLNIRKLLKTSDMDPNHINRPIRRLTNELPNNDPETASSSYLHSECSECTNALISAVDQGIWDHEPDLLNMIGHMVLNNGTLDTDDLYRYYHPRYPFYEDPSRDLFKVIAYPNRRLTKELRGGDILLTRSNLAGRTGGFIITEPAITALQDLNGHASNSRRSGNYIGVYGELGNKNTRHHFRISDKNSVLPDNILVIRYTGMKGGNLDDGDSAQLTPDLRTSESDFPEDQTTDASTTPALIGRESPETFYVAIDIGLRRECAGMNLHTGECTLRLSSDVEPKTGIFIPASFRPEPAIDLLIYLHGHTASFASHGRALTIDRLWDSNDSNRSKPDFPFREILTDSGKNMVLVAPTLGPRSQAGVLTTNDGFSFFISKVLASIGAYSNLYAGQSVPTVRSIILACHSGGGDRMRRIARLSAVNPYAALIKECWGFDCTYSGSDPDEWYEWASRNPDKTLYLYSIPGSQTASTISPIRNRRPILANVNLIPSSTRIHNNVPVVYMRERLMAPIMNPTPSFSASPAESYSTEWSTQDEDAGAMEIAVESEYLSAEDIPASLCTSNGTAVPLVQVQQQIADAARSEHRWWQNGPGGSQIMEQTAAGMARITSYWSNIPNPAAHNVPQTPWSAIFVSSCIKIAGDSLSITPLPLHLSSAHFQYAKSAYNRRFHNPPQPGYYWAYDPSTRPVQVGDIIVKERLQANHHYIGLTFDSLHTIDGASTHGDIVVEIRDNPLSALVIGGNVSNSVNQHSYPLTPDGKIDTSQTTNSANHVFAVLSIEPATTCSSSSVAPAGSGSGNGLSALSQIPFIGDLLAPIANLVQGGIITVEIGAAIMGGERSADRLTDMIFYYRHPERVINGVNIPLLRTDPNYQQLLREWANIRTTIIVPLLRSLSPPATRHHHFAYASLSSEYDTLFNTCIITPARIPEVDRIIGRILPNQARYVAVGQSLNIPWYFIAVIHNMESSLNFNRHLHNGDPLTARTVQVPAGRPLTGNPPFTWEESATDALTMQGLDRVGTWPISRILFELERYNGFGYRSRGINTPYIWSFSNHYTRGHFVADRRFDPDAVARNAGAGVILKRMVDTGQLVI